MLDTESQWSEALANNNIRAIICWLRRLTDEGESDIEKILPAFSFWIQRTSEFAKKEILTLCFSRCQGLWMFLDWSSFTRVHMLLQRLRNLLTLAHWARRQFTSAHLWHGVGVPCVVCRDAFGSSDIRHGCWNREHRALKQHIWLGRLVQWWGIMGLLPKYPEPHKMKRISQMWKEMANTHRKAYLETPEWSSFIQCMVNQLDKQHGCIWASEDCPDQCYPPPNLQALLKLVLLPRIDNMSVQAILIYFILDMVNFLQCKDNLLQSFCHAFTIPSSFSQQIRAFWMLDHGHIKAAVELLLSPKAAPPRLPWQHRCIIQSLLTRKQPLLALRYIYWVRPAIESIEDAKLCADVLLQNSCVSEAWTLLKQGNTESEDMAMSFLLCCDKFSLHAGALESIPAEYNCEGGNATETTGLSLTKQAGSPPCPLSAKLYQTQKENTVSPEELVRLIREAVMEVKKPQPKIRTIVWPEHREKKLNSREMFLFNQVPPHLTPSPSQMHMLEETEEAAHTDEPKRPVIHNRYHYVYESTLTLQRISSLLTDGDNPSRENEQTEEEESRAPSSVNIFPDCPDLGLTPDGTTDPISLSNGNFNEDILEVHMLPSEEGEKDVRTGVSSSDDCADAVSGPSTSETLVLNQFMMIHHPQVYREVSQSEPQRESRLFLSPEETACWKEMCKETVQGLSNVTKPWSGKEEQPDCTPPQSLSFSGAATSDCILEEPHQKGCELLQKEEELGCFTKDLLCALSDTAQNLLTDFHQSLLLEDPTTTSSEGEQNTSHFTPAYSLICPTQFQIPGSSLTTIPQCNTQANSASFDITNEGSPEAQTKADGSHDPSISAWLDHCKIDSWWKHEAETCGASSSHELAGEPGAAMTSDNKMPSFVQSQIHSYGLVNFMDFTAKQTRDNRGDKQADKDEPAGWSSLGNVTQGAIRSGRTRSRKGKRVKRA